MSMGRKTKTIILNRRNIEIVLFQKGDKVKRNNQYGGQENDYGIVESTEQGGLYVIVNWLGQAKHRCGKRWLASSFDMAAE
ncbi:hypothetical protein E4665_03780 [Sporolactobacillus shoreae]|uniref:Uncharacterized protein n=1 Tax=Sporolactobacillus shoreae TaxID=1465501 RepID=A0A4Z0GQA9_9BACL|nr:hypothetical protein [Sporolactobacillus shoreae]TGA99454.1 hypothetical protein E4665_03780 [Sporolactobacillus shoreae]